tara:strand:- start:269 stop:958 length:690 start_codon:yes stop_codon:yes gene_type:complete
MKYQHLFFDLDRTLWDFEINAFKTLNEMYSFFSLKNKGVTSKDFIKKYKLYNEKLWHDYRLGIITKDNLRSRRFILTLNDFGIYDNNLGKKMGDYYVDNCPKKTELIPYTLDVLDYLKQFYILHIITNGFHEVQFIKLKKSNLFKYFDQIITSEKAGVKKPDPKIFNYALSKACCKVQDSIMIGDDFPVDILGAKKIGMDQIYFNPQNDKNSESATFEINCLSQIKEIL